MMKHREVHNGTLGGTNILIDVLRPYIYAMGALLGSIFIWGILS